jgi:hypothetical protein
VKIVEPELEIVRISEPVCLALHRFDFVVYSLNLAGGDFVLEVVQKSRLVPDQSAGCSNQRAYSGFYCVGRPFKKEIEGRLGIFHFPKKAELFFHRIGNVERLVYFKERIETLSAFGNNGIVIGK